MRAYIFSIGEPTTDLVCDLMREYGFDVVLYKDSTSLWSKLKRFYHEALDSPDEEVIRIDADVIPNPNVKNLRSGGGWVCARGFDWYKQDVGAVSIHCLSRDVLHLCEAYINEAQSMSRPESHVWRIPIINEKTSLTEAVYGLHGYGQQEHRNRIKALKDSRNQTYDWSLVERIENL